MVANQHGPTLFIAQALTVSSIDAGEHHIRLEEAFFRASVARRSPTPEDRATASQWVVADSSMSAAWKSTHGV